jgi:RNA polymerase sigma-70 factor (ECF subfamily)
MSTLKCPDSRLAKNYVSFCVDIPRVARNLDGKPSFLWDTDNMALAETTIIQVLLAERAKLLAYAWCIVRDAHVAEDVFQQVSMLAIQRKEELQSESALPNWLRRSTRFTALAAIRDSGRDPVRVFSSTVLDRLDDYWASQDEQPAGPRLAAMGGCVKQLSPYARQIIGLRYDKGLSGAEVAEHLGRNVRTIYMALTRIHNALRECIERKLRTGDVSNA